MGKTQDPKHWERRVYKRADVKLNASLVTDTQQLEGTCVVVSVGGCGLMVNSGVVAPGPATVDLHLPDGNTLRITAEVLYHNDQGRGLLGMRFMALDQAALATLCQLSGIGH